MAPSTWRYRVVRQTLHDETLYGIHEAYDGGTSWTSRPVAPVAETVDELRDVLARMATAPDQPVLTDATPTAVDLPANVPPVRCPYCRDEFGPDELVDGDIAEVVCTMCAKAGRTATGPGWAPGGATAAETADPDATHDQRRGAIHWLLHHWLRDDPTSDNPAGEYRAARRVLGGELVDRIEATLTEPQP